MGGDIAKSPLVAAAQLFSGREHHFFFRARKKTVNRQEKYIKHVTVSFLRHHMELLSF